MSFLDKLKEKNAGATAPADKPAVSTAPPLKPKSPLGLPKSPLGLPKSPSPLTPKPIEKKEEDITAETPVKPAFLGNNKPNPFGKPKLPAGTVAIPPIEEEEVVVAETKAPETAAPEIVEEVDTTSQEAVDVSENKNIMEDIKEEDSKATTGKGSRSRGNSKNQQKKTPAAKPETATESRPSIPPVDTPTEPSVSYAEAHLLIQSPYVDPEWEAFKAAAQDSIDSIVISDDMNAGMMKSTISELSALRQQIWSTHQATKTMFEQIASKEPEGLIERVKKTNLGPGSNDLQRKKSGIEACMNYIDPRSNVHINLYEFLDETRIRHNFLKALMDSIQYKTQILITMSGALKLEKDHTPGDPA